MRTLSMTLTIIFLAALAAGCSAKAAATKQSVGAGGSSNGLPMSRSVAKRLPPGVFYLTAGPNPASYNVWEISNTGQEIRLTHNGSGLGISAFDASAAGIVMADAASEFDKLARLTAKGAVFLKNGDGSSPGINNTGNICYFYATYNHNGDVLGFNLAVRKSFSATARVIYRQKKSITGCSWGPSGAIVVLSGTHYPGTKGPVPNIFTISKAGKITTIRTGLEAHLSVALWNENRGGIAIGTWNNKGEVLYGGSRKYALPAGWNPAAWNSAGTELLVLSGSDPGEKIGLWSPAKPKAVTVIGQIAKKVMIGQYVWLAKPAKLLSKRGSPPVGE